MQHDAHVETRRIYYAHADILMYFDSIRSVRNSQLGMRVWLKDDGTPNDHWLELEEREKGYWDKIQAIAKTLPVPEAFDTVLLYKNYRGEGQLERHRPYTKDGEPRARCSPKFAVIGDNHRFWIVYEQNGTVAWVYKDEWRIMRASDYLAYVKELRAQRKEKRQLARDLARHVKECPAVPEGRRRPLPLAQWKKQIVTALLKDDVLTATVDGTTMTFATLGQRDTFVASIGGNRPAMVPATGT